ncbi:spore protein Tlp [Solibacillus sp. MA9]|uniref:Spore protein Tlp n=1 Tax=Solibacillus palustris TaxID=2908203 RepID=A0ABS9UHE8_9BACL|nr:spore protein Tlp [Solibacillus sp. MA9]MCH7323378.1 spore protein Tlp [Solibacillus sp. MA9]
MKNDRHDTFNKPSKNGLSVGKMINNTKENMQEAEISMEFATPEELEHLEEKNAHRKSSIAQMEKQIREEKAFKARKNEFK